MKESKLKNFIKKILLPAIGSCILAYFLGKILDPLLEFLYSKFLEIGTLFIDSFSDSIYQKVSDGFSEQPSMETLYASTYFFLLLFFVAFNSSMHHSSSVRKDLVDMTERNTITMKRCQTFLNIPLSEPQSNSNETAPEITASEILQRCQELDQDLSNTITKHDKNVKKGLAAGIIFYVFFSFYLLGTYAQHTFINSVIIKTTNNIEIVSPYITDVDYKKLKSSFHSIESKEDYDALVENLQIIADENSIKLKE